MMAHSMQASTSKCEGESLLGAFEKISIKDDNDEVIEKNVKSYFDENGFPTSDYHSETDDRIISPLEKAIQDKNSGSIESAINSALDINEKTYNNETMLHVAASLEDEETVAILIQRGADVNSTNARGESPLLIAAAKKNLPVLDKLISAGAEVNFMADDGDTPLHRAAGERTFKNVQLLLEKGADVKAKNKFGLTPLHVTTCSRSIKGFISKGADINAKTNKGDTPAHIFAYKDSLEGIKLLFKANAEMNLQNDLGLTPLGISATASNCNIVSFLLSRAKIPVNGKDLLGNAPLHYATRKGCFDTVQLLMASNADPNLKGVHGYTPLHIAAIFGHLALVDLLLQNGADVAAEDTYGNSPLMLAESHNQKVIAKALKFHVEELNRNNQIEETNPRLHKVLSRMRKKLNKKTS